MCVVLWIAGYIYSLLALAWSWSWYVVWMNVVLWAELKWLWLCGGCGVEVHFSQVLIDAPTR